jgi:hypothetical protein
MERMHFMDTINWPKGLFIFDGETLGLCEARHGIWEVGIIHPASGGRMSWMFRPGAWDAEAGALRVNGLTRDLWNSITLTEAEWALRFELWVRQLVPAGRITLVGRNPAFDLRMLEAVGKRLGGIDGALFLSLFHHRVFDLHGFVQGLALAYGWPFDAERIDDLYRRLGQQPEAKPHRALCGAEHALQALELMLAEVMRRAAGAAEADTLRDLLAEANAALAEEKAKTAALWKDYEMALATIQRHERATHGAATVAEVH